MEAIVVFVFAAVMVISVGGPPMRRAALTDLPGASPRRPRAADAPALEDALRKLKGSRCPHGDARARRNLAMHGVPPNRVSASFPGRSWWYRGPTTMTPGGRRGQQSATMN